MKKVFVFCVLLALWLSLEASIVCAVDVGWMQQGVRVWYYGAAGTGFSSDAEEAYLFTAIDGDNVHVTKHSAIDHWGTPNPPDTSISSFLGKGPCWIHPQTLQTLQNGDTWKGQVIATVLRKSYTYDTLRAEFSVGEFSIPYLLLPIKALFDLKSQRNLVKIVYYIDQFSTGIAYFDADTGLLLLYETSSGFVTVFFFLSEINYDFAAHRAFAEDNGPHTGFKSVVSEQQISHGINSVFIQSSVETRYGGTVQMLTSTSENGSLPPDENYCFFGSVPILRHIEKTAVFYPPEAWNAYGEYLWWWVPTEALQKSTINVFGVPMTRTSTSPYTFTATQQPAGFFFSKLWFDNDGYMTAFAAKDSNTGLDIDPGYPATYYKNDTTVNGLAYYKNTMGRAMPAVRQSKIGVFRTGTWYLDTNGNSAWDGCGTDGCIAWGGDALDKVVLGDWNGSGTTKIGVYRNGTWYLDANGNGVWDGCATDKCLSWGGDATDQPVVGDWNGSGTTKIGVYRKTTGTWYLDTNGNGLWDGCGTDACLGWGGDPTDQPVLGDWNGSGTTKIGVYRNGTWYLDANGNGTWDGCTTDKCLTWGGDPTDKAVLGDWNGSGTTKIGVYRTATGTWYLDTNGNGLWDGCGTDACLSWGGDPTDVPKTGDWNGTGSTKIGVYRASTGVWYLDTNGNGVWDGCGTDGCISWGGNAADQAIVGKW